jgi:hypothetical protein
MGSADSMITADCVARQQRLILQHGQAPARQGIEPGVLVTTILSPA